MAVEALVRWRHLRDGLLAPIAFLPDARRYGLMTELSLAVMRDVVADARRWAVGQRHEHRVLLVRSVLLDQLRAGVAVPVQEDVGLAVPARLEQVARRVEDEPQRGGHQKFTQTTSSASKNSRVNATTSSVLNALQA